MQVSGLKETKDTCGIRVPSSRNTLDLWLKPREQTGTVTPKAPTKKGPAPKIKDLKTFRRFAATHGHLTAVAMAI